MTSSCPENSAKRGPGQGRQGSPASSSRRKRGSRATDTAQAALDTGFRRYDGVCCNGYGRHAGSLPRRVTRPGCEGGWRAEKRKILMARALRHAGASRRANRGVFRQRALLSSGPSRIECADRAISQLLAGTPSGPGGSSAAARVPRCDEARRRRTSSRLRNASRERPLEGRGGCSLSEVCEAGINVRPGAAQDAPCAFVAAGSA